MSFLMGERTKCGSCERASEILLGEKNAPPK